MYTDRSPGRYHKRYIKKYPERKSARAKVYMATLLGKIPKISTRSCADCGEQAHVHHHDDYAKPLDVVPLCHKCHGLRHSTRELLV